LGKLPLDIMESLAMDSVLKPIYQECFPVINITNFWVGQGFVYWNSDNLYFRSAAVMNDCACLRNLRPELLLDLTDYVGDTAYTMVGYFEVIDDLIAVGLDSIGDENFALYIIHFPSKTTLLGPIPSTFYSARWVKYDSKYWVYYNIVDPKWGIPLSIGRAGPFTMSIAQNYNPKNSIIYTEGDPALTTELYMTNDLKYLFIKVNWYR
jgi:protease II